MAHHCHGKTKNLRAKTKYLTTKPKTWRQNQRPHSKAKYFIALKPNTARQKQIPTAKPKLFCFFCEVFGFAVRFLVVPWGLWFCRDVFVFALTVLGHHHRDKLMRSHFSVACSRLRSRWWWKSRSVIRNAKNARGWGETGRAIFPAATAPFPKSCASYFRFARFNTFPLYYLRAWHRLLFGNLPIDRARKF